MDPMGKMWVLLFLCAILFKTSQVQSIIMIYLLYLLIYHINN